MKSLRDGAEDYLTLRRGLGFKLKRPARFVRSFVESLEKRGETRITTQLALEWATEPQHLQPSEWTARLSGVRAFARYWSSIDMATEIPPEGLLPFRARRSNPYLYSDLEVQRLLGEARSMPAQFSLQPLTYHCLFGLLAVTGLRISEALNLESRDVNWTEGVLTIRSSKFGKSRLVPLHPTTKLVLADYAAQRILRFPDRPTAALSLPGRVPVWMLAKSDGPSTGYHGRLASGVPWPVADHACTTSATALPWRHCCAGIAAGKTSGGACRFYRPISGTATSRTPIGI